MKTLTLLLLAVATIVEGGITDAKVKVLRVSDGDTLVVDQRLWGYPTKVRLKRLDTPEKGRYAKCTEEDAQAQLATAHTVALIDASKGFVWLTGGKPDLYNRPLMEAVVRVNGKRINIADDLIARGLALPYNGGTKADWCALLKGTA